MRIWNKLFGGGQRKSILVEQPEDLSEFDGELRGLLKSMLESAFEYVHFNDIEVSDIYVFCSTEEGLFYYFFFKINGSIVDRHEVNENLSSECDDSGDRQSAVDEIGLADLEKVISLFRSERREIPTRMKVHYSVSKQRFETDLSYDNVLSNSSDLMDIDLCDQWRKELAKN